MPATDPNFNPAYSTIKAIYLTDEADTNPLNIIRQNSECVFERIEFVENANDVFPNGVLIVRDTKDIVSRVKEFQINRILVEFFDSTIWDLDITSVSYINNAASETEENFVGIYFSNQYYKLAQTTSLNATLGIKKPLVYKIQDFVAQLKSAIFDDTADPPSYNDEATNYVLYRPINTIENRNESVSDNAIEYLNYLSTNAVSKVTEAPTFMFWTGFDGGVNFKAFDYDLSRDPSAATIDTDVRRFAIFDGESVIQQLSDRKFYRKIYFYNTDPAYQYISKNYYYIRKTPKVLDVLPTGLSGDALEQYIYNTLSYQFQDEGQRYNVEVIDHDNTNIALPGADQIIYDRHWGYYDSLDSINDSSKLSHLGHQFGNENYYRNLNLMGTSGYMPYVDNTEMWKNSFDLTPIHPDYPNSTYNFGVDTKLQKLIDIRYSGFLAGVCGAEKQLDLYRKIELQNFIAYVLCCMGKKEQESFFAVLQRFEVDNTKGFSGTNNVMYRYKWTKIDFDAPKGSCGSSGLCGASGMTLAFHQLENWGLSPIGSSSFQDDTWAININERGLTGNYLPPGWDGSCLPVGFSYRPIGASEAGLLFGDIKHFVKMFKYAQGNSYFYYFTAENVVDGCCP